MTALENHDQGLCTHTKYHNRRPMADRGVGKVLQEKRDPEGPLLVSMFRLSLLTARYFFACGLNVVWNERIRPGYQRGQGPTLPVPNFVGNPVDFRRVRQSGKHLRFLRSLTRLFLRSRYIRLLVISSGCGLPEQTATPTRPLGARFSCYPKLSLSRPFGFDLGIRRPSGSFCTW